MQIQTNSLKCSKPTHVVNIAARKTSQTAAGVLNRHVHVDKLVPARARARMGTSQGLHEGEQPCLTVYAAALRASTIREAFEFGRQESDERRL